MALFYYGENFASPCDLIWDYIMKCGMRDEISGTWMISNCLSNKTSRELLNNPILKVHVCRRNKASILILCRQLYIGKLRDFISFIHVGFFLPVYRISRSYWYAQGSRKFCFIGNIFFGPGLWRLYHFLTYLRLFEF